MTMHRPLVSALATVVAVLPVITPKTARAQAAAPAPTASAAPERAPLIPTTVGPATDAASLERQGDPSARPGLPKSGDDQVFSDDWWRHTRPVVEIHGFFRTRAELFHNFSLGRIDPASTALWARPIDDTYSPVSGSQVQTTYGCGPNGSNQSGTNQVACTNKTQASTNMRFRIDPEIHLSDNLRILSEVDLLDNLVLGSTPEGSTSSPNGGGGYRYNFGGGYTPFRAFSTTQVPPTAGVNSYENSITVKRAWAEYLTPFGQLRFGRMPSHWGLGILANSGDKIDSDYQTTVDRIMFVTGFKSLDLYVAGMALAVFRRLRPDQQAIRIARGDVVINGGLYLLYRQQILANEQNGSATSNGSYVVGASGAYGQGSYQSGLTRIGAQAKIGDLWFQVLSKRLRWEVEAVYINGSIENPEGVLSGTYNQENWQISEFGAASELEYKPLGDELRLKFYTGVATGDQGSYAAGAPTIAPSDNGLQTRPTADKTVSEFQFNPAYNVDLILFREILTRVQGAYYFKPGVEYDFSRAADGEKFGGRAEAIWSRASKFVQTPGHHPDLGVELDATLYYQSRDGSLNDDPTKIGGFFAMLQYGVLFPLAGLGYQAGELTQTPSLSTSAAQTVRLFLGVVY
jgi:hypothetical protein